MCMPPSVKFIVDFEDPSGNVEVFSDQLGERMYKFLLIINVNATNRSWHIRQLEDLLGSWFGRIQMLFRWLATQDWNCKADWKLNIVNWRSTRHDIGLFALNEVLYLLQSFGAVKEDLGETEMVREAMDVVGYNYMETALRTVYFSNFKNFHIVTKDIRCHLERRHVNNLDIGIFQGENSTQLCVFSLQELFHGDSLELLNWHRVNMYLHSSALFDRGPLLLEFVHHFFPYE